MEHIMEQYGSVLLQLAGGAGMLIFVGNMLKPGGVLYLVQQSYLNGICG